MPTLDCLNVYLLLSLLSFMSVMMIAGGLVYIHVPALAVSTGMANGLGRIESVICS